MPSTRPRPRRSSLTTNAARGSCGPPSTTTARRSSLRKSKSLSWPCRRTAQSPHWNVPARSTRQATRTWPCAALPASARARVERRASAPERDPARELATQPRPDGREPRAARGRTKGALRQPGRRGQRGLGARARGCRAGARSSVGPARGARAASSALSAIDGELRAAACSRRVIRRDVCRCLCSRGAVSLGLLLRGGD
jgi:hypothetical protein